MTSSPEVRRCLSAVFLSRSFVTGCNISSNLMPMQTAKSLLQTDRRTRQLQIGVGGGGGVGVLASFEILSAV